MDAIFNRDAVARRANDVIHDVVFRRERNMIRDGVARSKSKEKLDE